MPEHYLKHKRDESDRAGYTVVEDSNRLPIFSYLSRRANNIIVRIRGTFNFVRGTVGGMFQFKKRTDTTTYATGENIGFININGDLYVRSKTADLFRVGSAGDIYVTKNIVMEGVTINDFSTSLVVTDPTANRIITFPDATGTVALTSDITGFVDTSGSPVDDDFAKFTDSNTIEGRSIAETKSDLSLDNVENKSSATIRSEIVSDDIPNNAADTSGQAGTVATIAGLAPDTATTQATQPNITTMTGFVTGSANQLITDDGDGTVTSEAGLTWDGDDLDITSSTSGRPQVNIKNTNSNPKGPSLFFVNDKGAAGALNDEAGSIFFRSDNSSQVLTYYGSIAAKAIGVTSGDESGTLVLSTASSDGSSSNLRNVITGTGSVSADTVGVDIGYGTSSATTIAGTLRINGDSLISAGNLTFTPGGTLELDSTGDMTLDSSGDIEINADGGDITFKDANVILAEINSTDGIFVGQMGGSNSHLTFETTTESVILQAPADAATDERTITLPDATGTVALTDTARSLVKLKGDDFYLAGTPSTNRWYHIAMYGQSISTSSLDGLSIADSTAIRMCAFIATQNCTVHKVSVAWYQTVTADLEWEIVKVPIVNNSTSNVTLATMTATDCDGSYTANTNYAKVFTVSGGNTLTAGQGLAVCVRRTSGSSSILYGWANAEIEITS